MTSVTHYGNNQEIGEILIKVQDEIKSLRTRLNQESSAIDAKSLQKALEKAENDIKVKTDQFINHLNNQVKTLPQLDEDELHTVNYGVPLESFLNMDPKPKRETTLLKKRLMSRSDSNPSIVLNQRGTSLMKPQSNIKIENDNQVQVYEEVTQIPKFSSTQVTSQALVGYSPGQRMKLSRDTKALLNPFNEKNRELINENYNIQLPLIEQRKGFRVSTHLITGTTIDHLSTLPLVYRRNPTLIPPPISDADAKQGLMSLLERGLIPSNAKITFEPMPIAHKKMNIVESAAKSMDKARSIEESTKASDVIYKLDPNYVKAERLTLEKEKALKKDEKKLRQTSGQVEKSEIAQINSIVQPYPPPATPNQFLDPLKKPLRFVIQNGFCKSDTQEYQTFKQFYCLHWGNIVSVIKQLEELCQNYVILVGLIDGHKVASLSNTIAVEQKPTINQLLEVFLNKDDIEKIIKTPGRRYLSMDGHQLAAITIQKNWRRFRDRNAYLKYRRRKWAAGVIALSWLTHVKMSKARVELRRTRIRQLENFRKRNREFMRNWPKIKTSKRVVIHLPSLGYNLSIRDNMKDLPIRENYQMARLCDIMDENVDVIYISSVPITEETLQYYSKLLGLRASVVTGNTTEQIDITTRYKIVIPEALSSFPAHNMALSTLLKYSPKAIERIKKLIKGRDAYIVPGIQHHDDLHIAEILNLPVLASEPEIAYLYSTKSGSKRIFQSAKVNIPFGEFDIYNKQQLHECLAQEITENLDVQRWIFKIDDECDGRGMAHCDIVKHLSCYPWALKEAARYGAKWSKKWAQEATYLKILSEIPEVLSKYAMPANKKIYPTWDFYEKVFLSQGGVLEAYPPSDNVTALTVSVLIEPDSTVKIISSGDHVHAESPYSCWGLSFPQSSVDSKELNEACHRIAEACKQRNIIGYFDIDFVTYICPRTESQILWATDLNISYSDHVAMSNLLYFMSNGRFDTENHIYEVDPPADYKPKRIKRGNDKVEEYNKTRYAVMSSRLFHTNLAVIHYSVFFQTCRAHGIGFDIKEKQGTVFTLVDSLNHSHLGMLTIGENIQATLQQFAHNLSALHQEISSANMQGQTNFLMAIEDIGNILGTTESNEEQQS